MSAPPAPPKIHPLHPQQLAAVQPEETVWLSASAGTGKTQVLSSRVLRLLLEPRVEPSQILCLTFTKAGATEMAARINGTLAEWVRAPETELYKRLDAIGASTDPATRARARTLFASVLDCPGGGLRIDTIHAFSQWLLGAFPHEAGLPPGTRPMDDRERLLLQRQVLSDLLVTAESDQFGDPQLLAAISDLSLRMGPAEVEAFLLRCADAREAWFGPGGWQEPMQPRVNKLLGLPADADTGHAAGLCGDDVFDVEALRRCLRTHAAWDTETGRKCADAIETWLAQDVANRAETVEALFAGLFTKKEGTPKQLGNILKRDPDYGEYIERVATCIARVREMCTLLSLAERLVPALRLGRAFALAWEEAKTREGLIDFDDQIRRAAALLGDGAYAQWIGYKLDRRFDHILVDEAQDTNEAQWRIIDALTQEFFAGIGQRGDILRTLFVVGDYKQAIFRFQGTSPENFEEARERVRVQMLGSAENARSRRDNVRVRTLQELGLDRSFRTAQPILDFVDQAIVTIGHENFGPKPEPHQGAKDRPGYVAVWRAIGDTSVGGEDEEADDGQDWLSVPQRKLADKIALQVKQWLDSGFTLHKDERRRAGPGDVMVLVRKRGALAALIVARLHFHGVPVAGVDRLRLGAPLAVRDLVAALRFAAQPLDDLNLASLLVSPLVGWTQQDLLDHGYRDKHARLWDHLRRSSHPLVASTLEQLGALLALADYEPPQALLHWLLVAPWDGRRRLVARLGREANDPIDELLNAAHAYAVSMTPSLVGFLAWFDAGEGELKREADNNAGLVRVMTVHGSKGLESPIVILADATGNPDNARGGKIDLPDPAAPELRKIPLPGLRRDEEAGPIAEAAARNRLEEEQEHWRLLYVAMTRAQEALFIGGALGAREKEPAPKSWYAKLRQMFGDEHAREDDIWGGRWDWGTPPQALAGDWRPAGSEAGVALPDWAQRSIAPEPSPPRPLAPSSLGEDLSPAPPFAPGATAVAARRGVLIHKLLERLPEVEATQREAAASSWLARNAADVAEEERRELIQSCVKILSDPAWADIFAPTALAEVPITAVVGGIVIAGTIDRLLVEPDRVRLVDFKTARRPPEGLEQVPVGILRQMAAYVAALEKVYPGRKVEAALLYTSAPRLIAIPEMTLAAHKQVLVGAQ